MTSAMMTRGFTFEASACLITSLMMTMTMMMDENDDDGDGE